MNKFLMGASILLIVILASILMVNINNVPKLDEDVKAAWSQVENQYERRADLIPNLVETVKGYATHEQDTFTKVVEARSKATQVKLDASSINDPEKIKAFMENQNSLSSALSRLMVVVEKYPDLKADKNFLALQSQLEGTENRISVARKDYIAAVKAYNTELRTIPGRWIAALVYPDAKPREVFKTTEAKKAVPKVKF